MGETPCGFKSHHSHKEISPEVATSRAFFVYTVTMTDLTFTSDLNVELVQTVGDDSSVTRAARVSTGLDLEDYDEKAETGLINYLVKKRHGSPFEHNSFTFRVEAPIFVFREFHRHRIGWSYNETSGRYKKLEPKFYIYPENRPIVQEGSGAHPKLVPGTSVQLAIVNGAMISGYQRAWKSYESALGFGAANEVARAVLPVGIYTSMYATCNARSLMAFLSLRTSDAGASNPQWEIEQIAHKMEEAFKKAMPLTWKAFNENGRVAP